MDPEQIGSLIYLVKTRRTFCSVIKGTLSATGLDSVRSAGVPQRDSVLLLCQQVHKKKGGGGWGANSRFIETSDASRIVQMTNLSLINDNNTLAGLFSANGGCHQIHF